MLITNDEAIELRAAAARLLYNNNRNSSDYTMLVNFINSVHSADVAPVIHAYWKHVADVFWECSNCKYTITGSETSNKYCQNCGAIMDGDKIG